MDRLRSFVRSSEVELMVLTLDAFNKARKGVDKSATVVTWSDAYSGRCNFYLIIFS